MSKEQKLEPGDRAPDGLALDADGREVSLQSYWAGGPVLLTFLRHFG
jgi:peroxiredoxin